MVISRIYVNLENVSVQYLGVYCMLILHHVITSETERAISNVHCKQK